MSKKLIITEKPSVARDFAKVLNVRGNRDGSIENDEYDRYLLIQYEESREEVKEIFGYRERLNLPRRIIYNCLVLVPLVKWI